MSATDHPHFVLALNARLLVCDEQSRPDLPVAETTVGMVVTPPERARLDLARMPDDHRILAITEVLSVMVRDIIGTLEEKWGDDGTVEVLDPDYVQQVIARTRATLAEHAAKAALN